MQIATRESRINSIVSEWAKPDSAKSQRLTDRLQQIQELATLKALPSFEVLLPLCLSLNGKPYSLKNYFPFTPIFRLAQPKSWLLKAGRQLSKSQSMAATSVMMSAAIPHYKTLHVTPLYEQIRRFSSNYVRPLIDNSPVKAIWYNTSTENSVLQRSFRNGSTMFFSFASNNADRIRGLSVYRCLLDELQDLDIDLLPIIMETMSAAQDPIPTVGYGGTPKTLDNPIEAKWRDSSQAEWVIKCTRCHKWNIPSLEFDLDNMFGEYSEFISEERPGLRCARCKYFLYSRTGRWVHRFPERRWEFAGYHIPQVILPLHYANPDKWSLLLAKRNGAGNMTRAKFCNEVLGESIDAGQKLVTETELRSAAILPFDNSRRPDLKMVNNLRDYHMKIMAVDWGGGGESQTSFTVIAVLGYLPSGEIHVIWAKRMVQSQNHVLEAKELQHWYQAFNCSHIAHDYTGAGTIRETVMVSTGLKLQHIIPIEYVGSAAGNIIRHVPASTVHARDRYRLDKTRSLLNLCNAIRYKKVKFFKYDYVNTENAGLIRDFLALIENKLESRSGSDIYTITRNPMLTDDFAQAVNIGCAALWHMNRAWPDFSDAIQHMRLNDIQYEEMGDYDTVWTDELQAAST